MKYFKALASLALAVVGFGAYAAEGDLVTVTAGVVTVDPTAVTDQLLTMQQAVILSVIGMIVLSIAFRLIVRKSAGACK